MIIPAYTLCFLLYEDQILMLHRHFPPNQGLWNGVGGHIENNETARQAIIREVFEETGYKVEAPIFRGVLTWEGYEISEGGLVIFTAQVDHKHHFFNHEGELAWKSKNWVMSSPDVVDNIPVFLPDILDDNPPRRYHFRYQDGKRVEDIISPLPTDFDLEKQFQYPCDSFEEMRGEFLLSFDKERLQVDLIEDFIVNRTHWGTWRSRSVIETSIKNSTCVGIYHFGLQVAFARLVTDQCTFAWVADVFVDESMRGQGLGKWMVEAIVKYSDQQGIRRLSLITDDAHALYANYGGFHPLKDPEKWMFRIHPRFD